MQLDRLPARRDSSGFFQPVEPDKGKADRTNVRAHGANGFVTCGQRRSARGQFARSRNRHKPRARHAAMLGAGHDFLPDEAALFEADAVKTVIERFVRENFVRQKILAKFRQSERQAALIITGRFRVIIRMI